MASPRRSHSRSNAEALTPTPQLGVVIACSIAVLISVLDLLQGPSGGLIGLLVAPPFLAAVFAPPRMVLAVGLLSTLLAIALGIVHGSATTAPQLIRVSAIIGGAVLAALLAHLRARAETRVKSLTHLAGVVQQAVLGPVKPHLVCGRAAVRYVSASEDAAVGGDLYETLNTQYGVRLLVGDVRGKGLEAVRLANLVLGSYRHVAFERSDLRAVVTDLDRVVARSVEEEDFVTACLLEISGGTVSVYNCGHPAPLLLRRGEVRVLEPPSSTPPLGFMPNPQPHTERLEVGDRILVFTDGLTEARQEGEFFPLNTRAWRILGHGNLDNALTSLENALGEWVSDQLDDDIALLLFEYTGEEC